MATCHRQRLEAFLKTASFADPFVKLVLTLGWPRLKSTPIRIRLGTSPHCLGVVFVWGTLEGSQIGETMFGTCL